MPQLLRHFLPTPVPRDGRAWTAQELARNCAVGYAWGLGALLLTALAGTLAGAAAALAVACLGMAAAFLLAAWSASQDEPVFGSVRLDTLTPGQAAWVQQWALRSPQMDAYLQDVRLQGRELVEADLRALVRLRTAGRRTFTVSARG